MSSMETGRRFKRSTGWFRDAFVRLSGTRRLTGYRRRTFGNHGGFSDTHACSGRLCRVKSVGLLPFRKRVAVRSVEIDAGGLVTVLVLPQVEW